MSDAIVWTAGMIQPAEVAEMTTRPFGSSSNRTDCRPEFARAVNHAMWLASEGAVQLFTPFVDISKSDIAGFGNDIGVPFELTWSCYQGGEVHCGRCGTCVERIEAFLEAGIADPTTYDRDGYWSAINTLRDAGRPVDKWITSS